MPKLYMGTSQKPRLVTLEWDLEPSRWRARATNLRIYFGRRLLHRFPAGRLPKFSEYHVGRNSILQIRQTNVLWMRVVRFFLDGVELKKSSRDENTLVWAAVYSLLLYAVWALVLTLLSGVSLAVPALMLAFSVYMRFLHRRQPEKLMTASAVGSVLLLIASLYSVMVTARLTLALLLSQGMYLYVLFSLNRLLEKRASVAESG